MLGFEPSDEGSIPSERSIYRSVAELADAAVSKTAEATRPDSTSGGATKIPKWWKGRHVGIRIQCPKGCASSNLAFGTINVGVAEQADAGDLKSPDFGYEGSIPSFDTKESNEDSRSL